MNRIYSSACFAWLLAGTAAAQEKVTFQDHVLPVVEANCAKCHNSDKKKGDLDLTSYAPALAGGASGKVVVSGDPDGSKIWKVVNHSEEPSMPPNRGKLADKDLAVIKKWIAGGLLENLGSKAVASKKPAVDLSLGASAVGKPEGPPPMPGDFLLDPPVTVKRSTAVTGLASSPWAPLIAVAGQKQVVLYHADSLLLLGILPFNDGVESYQPSDVRFSRNGKLLVVAGGHAAKSGRVAVYDITSGDRIIMVGAGQEFDTVLGADLSPDQSKIAAGGPSRMVRVYSTQDGSVLFKLKKHTDWVTAIAFSPSGEYLATADRNGGVTIWDTDNGLEVHTVAGHKSAVTALSWRGDSKLLASASEDGTTKLWEMTEGKQARTANAHGSGALSINFTHDGRTVTCGRDNQIVSWTPDGAKSKAYTFTNELPVRATFSHDGKRVFAADWIGRITVWDASSEKPIGVLEANPPTLAEQLAAAEARLKELEAAAKPSAAATAAAEKAGKAAQEAIAAGAAVTAANTNLAPKEAEVIRIKAEIAKQSTPELEQKVAAARADRNAARIALTNAVAALDARKADVLKLEKAASELKPKDTKQESVQVAAQISRLKIGQAFTSVYRAREALATKKREHEKLLASGSDSDKAAAEKLGQEIAKLEAELKTLSAAHEKMKIATTAAKPVQQSKL